MGLGGVLRCLGLESGVTLLPLPLFPYCIACWEHPRFGAE